MGHKGQLGLGESVLVQPTPGHFDFSCFGRTDFITPRIHIGPNHAIVGIV